ncbi:MAG: hypothetical protein UW73_C0034G0003 [Microgenomates group bacterium GW2011_GWB1_44_8]|nr:MAG: hypothetical protein UW73_C0034G0003 [Microgenomates group bacterium GW2011_GWB1_44_8]
MPLVDRLRTFCFPLILSVLVFTGYGATLNNGFVSDDHETVVNNPNLGSMVYFSGSPLELGRKLVPFVVYGLFGPQPFYFHLANISFHLLTTFGVYLLFSLLSNRRVGFLSAGIFAVHPIGSEAVNWVTGGSYLMGSFWFIWSLNCYILSGRLKKKYPYFLSVGLFFLSVTSSPLGIALWLIVLLYELVFGDIKKRFTKLLPFMVLSSVLLMAYAPYIGSRALRLADLTGETAPGRSELFSIPFIITYYLRLIIWPDALDLYHWEGAGVGQKEIVLSYLGLGLYLVLILISLRKQRRLFFGLAFFLIALAPSLSGLGVNSAVAERYAYLAFAGLAYGLGMLIWRLVRTSSSSYLWIAVFCMGILMLTVRTIQRGFDWRDETSLAMASIKTSPYSPKSWQNLGNILMERGYPKEAITAFMRAGQLLPNDEVSYLNIGVAYLRLGQPDEAFNFFSQALKLNPKRWQVYGNLAMVYAQRKQYDQALDILTKGLAVSPNYFLYTDLGDMLRARGEKDRAGQAYKKALELNPRYQLAIEGLAKSY